MFSKALAVFLPFISLTKGEISADWLIRPLSAFPETRVSVSDSEIAIENGILTRKFALFPGFFTSDYYSHEDRSSLLRALNPEVIKNQLTQ